MSAYMVDPEVLSLMLYAAKSVEAGRHESGLSWWTAPCHKLTSSQWQDARREVRYYESGDLDEAVYQMLVAENVRSVSYRYKEQTLAGDHYAYQVTPAIKSATPVDVLKALACYEYQSCETPDWPESEAFQFCRALEHKVIRTIPGYNESGWWK